MAAKTITPKAEKIIEGLSFNNKRILVTGGAGAIGSNLVRELLKYSCKIVILDDLSSGYIENVPKNSKVEFIKGSVTDNRVLKRVFSKKIHIVFHLAAFFANQNSIEHPDTDLMTNGYGTLNVLQHAKDANVERFVYASSSCVYGDVQSAAIESHKDFHLDTPYAITKLLGEYYAKY
jgi:UDP-glucose 4-epimerase